MKKKILSSVIILVALVFVSSTLSEDHPILKVGKKAPLSDLKMKNIDGSQHSLASLTKENGLLVVFSCNTCPFVVGGNDFPGWEKDYNKIYQEF